MLSLLGAAQGLSQAAGAQAMAQATHGQLSAAPGLLSAFMRVNGMASQNPAHGKAKLHKLHYASNESTYDALRRDIDDWVG